jgi:flavin-dependent dehydrogenase
MLKMQVIGDNSIPLSCDVAIAGSGPAGSATALRLAKLGYDVVMLEKTEFESPRIGESLAPGIQPLLKRLGVWKEFLNLRPLPSYGTRSTWGASEIESHSHLFSGYDSGWHVDRMHFDQMLASTAKSAGAKLITGAKVMNSVAVNKGVSLEMGLHNKTYELAAKFLVDATGRRSISSSLFGAKRIAFDRLVGVGVQLWDDEASYHCYTLIESTPDGWWYCAPIDSSRTMIILMTDGDIASSEHVNIFNEWDKLSRRTSHISNRILRDKIIWGPRIFSAVSYRAIRSQNDSRPWLSVGDSNLSVDPISGSGVIRALRMSEDAASTIVATLKGDTHAIERYELRQANECARYLDELAYYYNMEQRWAEYTFWQRRKSAFSEYLNGRLVTQESQDRFPCR